MAFANISTEWEGRRGWETAHDQLYSIRSLVNNWDGAGAKPIPRSIINSASDILEQLYEAGSWEPPSRIVATPSGSVVFEWHMLGIYAEAEILDPYVLDWMVQRGNGPIKHTTEKVLPSSRLIIKRRRSEKVVEEPYSLVSGEANLSIG